LAPRIELVVDETVLPLAEGGNAKGERVGNEGSRGGEFFFEQSAGAESGFRRGLRREAWLLGVDDDGAGGGVLAEQGALRAARDLQESMSYCVSQEKPMWV